MPNIWILYRQCIVQQNIRRLWQYCRDAPDDNDIAGCVISEAGQVIFLKTSDENLKIIQTH